MTSEKPALLVEELETLATTIQVWLANEDGRMEHLRAFADMAAGHVKASMPANVTLAAPALAALFKASHLVLGLVGTAKDLVTYRDSLLPKPPSPDMN